MLVAVAREFASNAANGGTRPRGRHDARAVRGEYLTDRSRHHRRARLYRDALGLTFEGGEGDYVFTEQLPGVKHFGLWPLREAAQACFGTEEWPPHLSVPQASVEFEVEDVAAAAAELENCGHRLIHPPRTEPWTQVTARLLSPEGLLVAVCFTPWLHGNK